MSHNRDYTTSLHVASLLCYISDHPNIKCYLGHGGLLGLSEGVYVGVPMILIPMFGDQFNNAAAAKNRGVAEIIAFNDLNERSLKDALDRVFNNIRYAVRLSIYPRPTPERSVSTPHL